MDLGLDGARALIGGGSGGLGGAIATVQGSPFQCMSENIGMTCVNTTGKKGFFLAKGVYQAF